MLKDLIKSLLLLAKKDLGMADLLIDILFVGLVVAGSTAFLLLKQAISNAQDINKSLESENKELKADNNRLGPQLKQFDGFVENQSLIRQEIIKLTNELQEALADGAKKTQELEGIEYFLDNLTQLEQEMTDNLKRIKAGKQLFEEQEDWTKEYIKSKKINSKEKWWQKLSKKLQKSVKSLTQPPSR
jgi:hypothetical protein